MSHPLEYNRHPDIVEALRYLEDTGRTVEFSHAHVTCQTDETFYAADSVVELAEMIRKGEGTACPAPCMSFRA